jgi:CheY-like chemotaxis protein
VDDSAENRMMLRKTLTPTGATITEAERGQSAIEAAAAAMRAGAPFTLVLLDSRMPGMDGFETAARLRQLPHALPAILMLSSDNRAADAEQIRKVGIAGYLVKPIARRSLFHAIETVLSSRQAPTERGSNPASHTRLRPLRILMAEDSQDNVFVVRAFLRSTGYKLEVVPNGRVAVERFPNASPDVVLMDVQMPLMDGYSATRAIRAWEKQNGRAPVPIIAFTAHALKNEVERAAEAGCTMHLTKPVCKADLLRAIQSVTTATPTGTGLSDEEIADLVPGYLANVRTAYDAMQRAHDEGQFQPIQFNAHDLKGTGAAMGFAGITALGGALEAAAKASDAALVQHHLEELRTYLITHCPAPVPVEAA